MIEQKLKKKEKLEINLSKLINISKKKERKRERKRYFDLKIIISYTYFLSFQKVWIRISVYVNFSSF